MTDQDDGRRELTALRYALLLAPMLLALTLVIGIQRFPAPLRNEFPVYWSASPPPDLAAREAMLRDRVTIAALLELFVITLLVRPWEFPWRARRWGIAGAVLFVWSGFMLALAQHGGRLLAWHALALAGLALTVFPLVTVLLLARHGWRRWRRPAAATAAGGQQ